MRKKKVTYPNPANDIITLRVNTKIEKESIFYIYDERGQLLLSENRFLPQGVLELKFDIYGLPKGVYFIKEAGNTTYHSFIILR